MFASVACWQLSRQAICWHHQAYLRRAIHGPHPHSLSNQQAWTNNCVGHGNYRAFLLMCIYLAAACLHALALVLQMNAYLVSVRAPAG